MSRGGHLRNLLLLLAGLLLLNALARRFTLRWDLTDDDRYTLSPSTQAVLDSLPEHVTITAWFTQEMPPDLALVRQDLKDMLVEYAARSHDQVEFSMVDPTGDEAAIRRAQQEGVRPLMAQTREKDKAANMQVFMGAVVRMAGRKAVIPVVQRGAALEWALTSAILEVQRTSKPTVGVMQGHGEPSTGALDQLSLGLDPTYMVEPTTIYEAYPINERFHALLLIDPVDSLPPGQLRRLEEYMAKGHGVVVAYSAVRSDLTKSAQVVQAHPSMAQWLYTQGVAINPYAVADQRCGQIKIMQAGIPQPISIDFPYYPVIQQYTDHPVANGMDLAMFQFASPLSWNGDTTLRFMPIALSGPNSGLTPTPFTIDPQHRWTAAELGAGPQVLAAAVERNIGGLSSRLVVFGNGTFCTGIQAGQPVELPSGNIDLMVNALDWVSHNTVMLELRGKETTYRPITMPEEGRRTALKWMNLLLPMALVGLAGLLHLLWRRRQRTQRTRPGHVR